MDEITIIVGAICFIGLSVGFIYALVRWSKGNGSSDTDQTKRSRSLFAVQINIGPVYVGESSAQSVGVTLRPKKQDDANWQQLNDGVYETLDEPQARGDKYPYYLVDGK